MGYKLKEKLESVTMVCPEPSIMPEEDVKTLLKEDYESLPKCRSKKVYDHCRESYAENKTFLHIYKEHVPRKLFPQLHHPESPAKTSYIITNQEAWADGDDPLQLNCDVIYLTRTGQRASQPNKCVSIVKVPEGVASIVQLSHRVGYTALKTNQYMEDYSRGHSYKEERLLLAPLLRVLEPIKQEFLRIMGSPIITSETTTNETIQRRTVTVMVANEGVMDLLLNFLCSAEAARIDLHNIMVFVGREESISLVESIGVHAMYSPALGSMPSEAAGGYLDTTFARMMWFKTTSVYLALSTGFDVLFQVSNFILSLSLFA
jgi:hypothetical protein